MSILPSTGDPLLDWLVLLNGGPLPAQLVAVGPNRQIYHLLPYDTFLECPVDSGGWNMVPGTFRLILRENLQAELQQLVGRRGWAVQTDYLK